MEISLKPSGAKATGLPPSQFQIARLRLTLLYAASLALILGVSSFITYVGFTQRLERKPIRSQLQRLETGEHGNTPNEEKSELLNVLIFSNGILLIAATGLSYWLAGLTLAPIQEVYSRQKEFISDASHELRTPLAILRTDIENAAASGSTSSLADDWPAGSLDEIDRMADVVSNLLLLSRAEESVLFSRREKVVDLVELVSTAMNRLQGYAEKHGIKLINVSGAEKANVNGESELLLRGVRNVVKNAIDYTAAGGTVTLSVLKHDGSAQITIQDTGIGIAPEEQPKVFNRFYRVDKSRSRSRGGSGLGLPIVKTIVEQHGGDITLESVPGQGTTITIRIPLA